MVYQTGRKPIFNSIKGRFDNFRTSPNDASGSDAANGEMASFPKNGLMPISAERAPSSGATSY
jgi:hypothetical protein